MANIVFIAVQCCQCSTMQAKQIFFFLFSLIFPIDFKFFFSLRCDVRILFQVKQQKKSSNKWTCVVCNEKQSVRKVFARGFMAKDIRKFVQSFNMSRSFAEESLQLTVDCEASFPNLDARSAEIEDKANEKENKKRRVNWNEYLDEDVLHDNEIGAEVEGELEQKIVTEWPDELFKRPKLKSRDLSRGQCEDSNKPVFSKRNRDGCQVKSKNRLTVDGTDKGRELSQKLQPAKSIPVAKLGASKWDQYIEKEDGNQCLTEREYDSKAADDLTCRLDYDLEVEEDIHPDFM
ncbi:hypothetical protein V2J09_017333 [Rumex salicifolius]